MERLEEECSIKMCDYKKWFTGMVLEGDNWRVIFENGMKAKIKKHVDDNK